MKENKETNKNKIKNKKKNRQTKREEAFFFSKGKYFSSKIDLIIIFVVYIN